MKAALRDAGKSPADVGHINAHGLSTTDRDADEARAIRAVFGAQADEVPVTALKSYFGNLGAGSGVVELIASVLALREGRLPRVLNYKTPDPDCPLPVVADDDTPSGRSFLNLSVTPQGQAAVFMLPRSSNRSADGRSMPTSSRLAQLALASFSALRLQRCRLASRLGRRTTRLAHQLTDTMRTLQRAMSPTTIGMAFASA